MSKLNEDVPPRRQTAKVGEKAAWVLTAAFSLLFCSAKKSPLRAVRLSVCVRVTVYGVGVCFAFLNAAYLM